MTLSQQFPGEMLPVKALPLTKGKVAIIDPEDYPLVSQYSWHAIYASHSWYAVRDNRDHNRTRGTSRVYLHKLLTGYARTDHHNGNGLDNRRYNLRDVTHAQNIDNSHSKPGSSRFKGVTLLLSGVWRARIVSGGTRHSLGCFASEDEAAEAYDEAARQAYGQYGRYNFPRPGEQSALR